MTHSSSKATAQSIVVAAELAFSAFMLNHVFFWYNVIGGVFTALAFLNTAMLFAKVENNETKTSVSGS